MALQSPALLGLFSDPSGSQIVLGGPRGEPGYTEHPKCYGISSCPPPNLHSPLPHWAGGSLTPPSLSQARTQGTAGFLKQGSFNVNVQEAHELLGTLLKCWLAGLGMRRCCSSHEPTLDCTLRSEVLTAGQQSGPSPLPGQPQQPPPCSPQPQARHLRFVLRRLLGLPQPRHDSQAHLAWPQTPSPMPRLVGAPSHICCLSSTYPRREGSPQTLVSSVQCQDGHA